MPAKKKPAKKMSKKKPAAKMGPVRLPAIPEDQLTPEQRSLMGAIASGPRGTFKMSGPFFCYLHAPGFGELAQKLGAYCRFGTSIAPRLTEFAILATAQFWKAHYEWAAHEPQALKAGVKPATIQALRAGREPSSAPKDERALYAFIKELYATRRAERSRLQGRACGGRRCRHGRAGRPARLLRHGGDDAQRIPDAGRGRNAAAVQGADNSLARRKQPCFDKSE